MGRVGKRVCVCVCGGIQVYVGMRVGLGDVRARVVSVCERVTGGCVSGPIGTSNLLSSTAA